MNSGSDDDLLPSLRRRMSWRVIAPLALTWLLGSVVTTAVAYVYTRKAFDRTLVDDAYAIAANVALDRDGLRSQLTPRELGAVLFDPNETVYFAVLDGQGRLMAGQGDLVPRAVGAGDRGERYGFEDRHYRGHDLRLVTLRRDQPAPHTVIVAETTNSRSALAEQLLLASVAPQALLLLLLGLWLRRSIGTELAPLARLEEALEQRDTNDLTPVDLEPRSRDIAHLADAFNALMARIDAGVTAQREFAGNVAHELRTPLAGIRSLAEYGLAQKDPAAWAAQLRSIVASEARASHLVDQLLALALADEARESLQLAPVAIDAVLRDLLLRLLPRADAAGVDLGAEGIDEPIHAIGTAALVEGVLGNLIDNALRYGRPREAGVKPHVTVHAEPQGAELLLTVTDNGPGMDEAQRQRVLARWEQGASGVQQGSGAGLGLAIVARYVALLGGRLSLQAATEGRGLRACVWLLRS
ncbi:MAG: sensor histidine kinase [Burkholderiales bacterium]|nr:sensor histidine kinase [Burkholderiales bacterium]